MQEKSSRRRFLKRTLAAGAALGSVAAVGGGVHALLSVGDADDLCGPYPDGADHPLSVVDAAAPRPNVLLIYCDDLGYGDLGCYGNEVIRTPNVDRLAEEGVRFTDYYACSAVCAPSRAGLLTGRYPYRTGILGNTYPRDEALGKRLARRFGVMLKGLGVLDIREDYVARGISPAEITLPEALEVAGYRTGMLGKWHLGDYSREPEFNPLRHGFDEYLGVPYSNDMSPLPLYRNEKQLEADLGNGDGLARLTGMYTREAVRFIESRKDAPFFLYLAHTFPHQPLFASERFAGKSRAGRFGDAVEEIDWSTGELLACLRRNGLEENTLVIFTSDNGPWYEGSAGALRGRKGQSLEGGFRVPFVARWPGHIPAGRVEHSPAMNIDLYPTLLGLAGVSLPADRIVDGKDILGLLRGTATSSPHEALFFYHYDQLEGVRMGRWKYYERVNRYVWPIPLDAASLPNRLGKKQLGERWPLLYDLADDPGESYNVIDQHPEIAARLRAAMRAWDAQLRASPRGFRRG